MYCEAYLAGSSESDTESYKSILIPAEIISVFLWQKFVSEVKNPSLELVLKSVQQLVVVMNRE